MTPIFNFDYAEGPETLIKLVVFKGSAKNNFPFSHLSFGLSLADTHSQNPRNSLLFLWFCSIESTKCNLNLSANSAKLFLAEP